MKATGASRTLLCLACVPKLGCPLCWPALAAICSMFGMPFRALNHVALAMTLVSLALVIVAVLLQRGRVHGSLWLAAASLSASAAYRTADLPAAVGYAATGGLLLSVLWHFAAAKRNLGMTRPPASGGACLSCTSLPDGLH